MYIPMYVCMYVHTHVHTYVCMYVHTYVEAKTLVKENLTVLYLQGFVFLHEC
jgi:hypothetical protein